tara:strand:+ start:1162 stop:1467 length:306 start_codon:yes stop_codon:yes gene_type:complete
MAKQSSIQKNLRRQLMVKKYKQRRLSLKKKIKNKNLDFEERLKLQSKLHDLPKDSSRVRIRNRCQITGRSRGVYRKFGISRIKVRELSLAGSLPGIIKASW